MTAFRESSVALSFKLRWCLARIAEATRTKDNAYDSANLSADSLAEQVLEEWIEERYPAVMQIWNEREALGKRAVEAAKPKVPEVPPAA